MEYKTKVCQRCGQEYQSGSNHSKFCLTCRPQIIAENKVIWAIAHPETVKKYRTSHLKEKAAYDVAYRVLWCSAHSDYLATQRAGHREGKKIYDAAYHVTNSEKIRASVMAWKAAHPEQVKTNHRTSTAKRRALGFLPLNFPFPGCEGHHIDHDHVLYIPAELHCSIPHNVWNGRNMDKINAIALAYAELSSDVLDDTLPFN